MRRRLPAPFFVSLIFHGVVFYLLLKTKTPAEREKPTIVQVEWLERKAGTRSDSSAAAGSLNGARSGPASPPATSARPASLKKAAKAYSNLTGSMLSPKMATPGPEATALNPAKDAEARGTGEWRDEDWGKGGGDFGEIVNFMPYDRLREEIRGLLNYPGILARRGINGTVNTRLAFTHDSQCDWKKIKIDSHERHLRVYVLALLKKLCGFTVIKNMKMNSTQVIDLSFQFDLINETTPYSLQRDQDFIVGNVIAFRRTTPKSLMEYQLGPIRGVWFAPAVALDFPWLVEKWDYYVNDVDPMAPFRE